MAISKRTNNQSSGMSSSTYQLYGFNNVMRKMIAKMKPEPKKEVIKPPRKINPNILLTDEQVIECRTRYEQEGWNKARLLEEYSKFGVSAQYLTSLLTYMTRSKLYPPRRK